MLGLLVGLCWLGVPVRTLQAQAFNYLGSPVDVSPGTAGSWVDVDASAYLPAGASGVILQVVGTTVDRYYGVRMNGSTDIWMAAQSTSKGDDMTFLMVGVDANRIFEVKTEDTAVKTYLVGYTGAGVKFFTNAVNKSLAVTGAYQDVGIGADTGADTAIGAIFTVQNTAGSGYEYALRRKGSTDDLYRQLRADVSTVHLIGVDASEVAQMKIANASLDLYLMGYVTNGAVFFTNAVNCSTGTTGSYVDVDITAYIGSDDANGALVEILDVSENSRQTALRPKGATYDYYATTRHQAALVGIDANDVFQQKIANADHDLYLLGYTLAAGPGTNRYWVASSPGNWNDTANWSTTSGGPGGASVPGASDVAYFDGAGSKNGNCTINAAVSVHGLSIGGYTGTITQGSGNTVTIGASNFSQASGTFTGSSGTVDVNGHFTLSGGTCTAPSGTLSVSGDFSHAAGTFTHNSGTVVLDGTSQSVSGATAFHHLSKTVAGAATLTLEAGQTNVVLSTLTLQGASGQLLALRSTVNGAPWYLDPQGSRSASYLDVKDAFNVNTRVVGPTRSTDTGNNTRWFAVWGDANWGYRKQIVIDRTKVGGSLTNFPMLISHVDSDLQYHAQSDGDDLVFTAQDGITKLSHEIESYASSNGTLVAWVKLPTLSSNLDTSIYLYYGHASATNQQNRTNVWEANYKGVWHLGEVPMAGSVEVLRPQAPGDVTGLTSFSGGANWGEVDDLTPDEDTTRVYNPGTGTLYDLYHLPNSAVASGTITNVTVRFRVKGHATFTAGFRAKLKTHGVEYQGTEIVHLGAAYTDYAQAWANNPFTGTAWTWAEIDALQAGIFISNQGAASNSACTQMYVEVSYVSTASLAYRDSTAHANDGGDYVQPTASAGQVGTGQQFDGTDDFVEVSDHATLDFGSADFTASMWVKKQEASAAWDNTWGIGKWNSGANPGINEWALTLTETGDNDKFFFIIEEGTSLYYVTDTNTFSLATWYYVTGVKSGTYLRLYVNGDEKSALNIGTHSVNNVGRNFRIANSEQNLFLTKGCFDEVRVSATARSAAWIWTEYHNQSAPGTFCTVYAQESAPVPTAVGLLSFSVQPLAPDRVDVAWITASETDNAGFHLYGAPAPDGPYTRLNPRLIPAQGSPSAGASYSLQLVVPAGTLCYALEDVDLYGQATILARVFFRPSTPLRLTPSSTGAMTLDFTPEPGWTYTVFYRDDLEPGTRWQPLPHGPHNAGRLTDLVAPGIAQRFYTVVGIRTLLR